MRCAIYARYSSDMQKQTSIDDQVRECRDFIRHKDWQVSDDEVYIDHAESGAELNRPGYLALKESAHNRQFDCIVIDDLSRLGRDAGESIQIFQELRAFEIGIVSVSDGIDTLSQSAKIPYYFKSIANELFLDELKSKIVRGLKGQVSRGYSAGGRIYGYDAVPELFESGEQDKFGRPRRYGVRMRINEEEAKVILKIFGMRKLSMGYRAIAHELNHKGIPSPHAGRGERSGAWCSGTVRAMLNREKYIGDWTWNKTRWFKKNVTGKRLMHENSPEKWIEHRDESLRIVPQDLWDAVHENTRKATKRDRRAMGGRRGQYPLSGILTCNDCGASLIIHGSKNYSGYVCNSYWNKGSSICDCRHRLPRDTAEKALFLKLTEWLSSTDVIEQLVEGANSKISVSRPTHKNTKVQLSQKETKLLRSIENLLDLAEQGNLSESLRNRLVEKESELESTRRQLARITTEKRLPEKVDSGWVTEKLLNVSKTLKHHPESINALRAVLASLFPEKLSVKAVEKAGKTVFRISGKVMPLNALSRTALPLMSYSGAGTYNAIGTAVSIEVTVNLQREAA